MRPVLTACAFVFLVAASLVNAATERDAQLQRILDGTVDLTTLPDETRSRSIGELRGLAQSGETKIRQQATTALLNLNDTQTVHQVLQELGGSSARKRKVASQILAQGCRNPDILPALADVLFTDEEPGMELVQGEYLLPRRSTVAADAIRQIIASSPSFPPATREWAQTLARTKPDALRKTLRTWWHNNAAHIHARTYDRAAPVSNVTTTNTPNAVQDDLRR